MIIDLADQYDYGDAKERLRTLIRSAPIPSDPIGVLIQDPNEQKILQDCLVATGATPDGKDALARFWGNVQGLSKTAPTAYDGLVNSVKELALSESDLIKSP